MITKRLVAFLSAVCLAGGAHAMTQQVMQGNCDYITDRVNAVMSYPAISCTASAARNQVYVKPTAATRKRNDKGFVLGVLAAFGRAVQEDYFGTGTVIFVQHLDAGGKCMSMNGEMASFLQQRVRDASAASARLKMEQFVASATDVSCPTAFNDGGKR